MALIRGHACCDCFQSLRLSKQLLRAAEMDVLHATNERECALLMERWQSDECMDAVMKFFQSKL